MNKNISAFLIFIILFAVFSFLGCSQKNNTLSPKDSYEIDLTSCNSCGKCSEVCPYNAIDNSGDKPVIIQSKCVGCGKCSDVCPKDAIN